MQWLYASTQCFKIVFTVDMIVIKKKTSCTLNAGLKINDAVNEI